MSNHLYVIDLADTGLLWEYVQRVELRREVPLARPVPDRHRRLQRSHDEVVYTLRLWRLGSVALGHQVERQLHVLFHSPVKILIEEARRKLFLSLCETWW